MADDSSEIVKEGAEAVSFENVKTTGGLAAFYAGLQMQQSLDAAAGWRSLNQAIVTKAAELIMEKQVEEAGGLVAALQQLMKGAQTTPPVTG